MVMDSETFAKAHRVLAEPKRVEILETIRRLEQSGGVTCSCVLAELSVSQSTFSHHVSALVDVGFVCSHKEGRCVRLTVNQERIDTYLRSFRVKVLGASSGLSPEW